MIHDKMILCFHVREMVETSGDWGSGNWMPSLKAELLNSCSVHRVDMVGGGGMWTRLSFKDMLKPRSCVSRCERHFRILKCWPPIQIKSKGMSEENAVYSPTWPWGHHSSACDLRKHFPQLQAHMLAPSNHFNPFKVIFACMRYNDRAPA